MTFDKSLKSIAVMALAICACWVSNPAAAAEKVTVILDFPYPVGEHAALQLALVKGWYAQEGLDVDIQMGKGSQTTIQQVAAGQAQIGEVQLSAMATSISSGLPVTSIMGMVQLGDLAVTLGDDTGFKTIKDLKGKKIAVPSSGAVVPLLGSFFEKTGVAKSDVNVLYVDSTALLSTFTAKSVDGLVAGASYTLPRTSKLRPSTSIYFSDVGLNLPGYGLITRRDVIQSHPDMLRKMVQINQRAWSYIMDGHEQEGVDAMVKRGAQFRPNGDILIAELKLLLPRFVTPNTKGHPVGWQSPADWRQSLNIMQSVGLVKPNWKLDDFYDNRFISQK